MLRLIRIFLAAVSFIAVLLLFMDLTGALHPLLSWAAQMQLIPAFLALNVVVLAILALMTMVLGRVYCSVICPMGIFQDIVSNIRGRFKPRRFSYSPAKKILRITVLAIFILALVLGVSAIYTLIEPYSAFGRITANLLAPLYGWTNNLLALWSEKAGNYMFYSTDVLLKSGLSLTLALITFLVIGYLAFRSGRTYCNTFCPVGTILGYLSKFSWLKIRIDTSKCVHCGLCSKNCKASCIDFKNHSIDYTRCVACMDCIGKCHSGAIKYATSCSCGKGKKDETSEESTPKAPKAASTRRIFKALLGDQAVKEPQAASTRRVITTIVGAIAATAVARAQYAVATTEDIAEGGLAEIPNRATPPRAQAPVPPGSVSFRHLSQHCTACQLCISQCPNHVLKASMSLDHFLQPVMDYSQGYCRPECNVCSQVCPNDAIRPISTEDKSSIKIGHAVYIQENCIVTRDGQPCGNCERHCPSGAITMTYLNESEKRKDEEYQANLRMPAGMGGFMSPRQANQAPVVLKVPVINKEKCIGCGACEHLCPARPEGAIYVEGCKVQRTV